jgi:sugar lactone lactonase YvrE
MLINKLMGAGGASIPSTPYTIETPRFLRTFDTGTYSTTGITFQPDGLTMYLASKVSGDPGIFEYNLSTAWDISTAVASGRNLVILEEITDVGGIQFLNSGSSLWGIAIEEQEFFSYEVPTAWNLASSDQEDDLDMGDSVGDGPNGLHIVEDAPANLYVTTSIYNTRIKHFRMTQLTPDPDRVNVISEFDPRSQDNTPKGITMNPTQTKMFLAGAQNDKVYQYSLSTAGDLSTVVYDNISLDLTSNGESFPNDICFGDNGNYLYVTGFNYSITQYAL